jgi:hypothetical protein
MVAPRMRARTGGQRRKRRCHGPGLSTERRLNDEAGITANGTRLRVKLNRPMDGQIAQIAAIGWRLANGSNRPKPALRVWLGRPPFGPIALNR